MNIKCYDDRAKSEVEKEWTATIERLKKTKAGFEASITASDWLFHIVVGKYQFGYYLCIPNWKVGIELSSYKDIFWNLEQLSNVMERKNAISVVTSIKSISEYFDTITE